MPRGGAAPSPVDQGARECKRGAQSPWNLPAVATPLSAAPRTPVEGQQRVRRQTPRKAFPTSDPPKKHRNLPVVQMRQQTRAFYGLRGPPAPRRAETLAGRTPDLRVRRGRALVAYCEVKSPRDDWLDEQLGETAAFELVGGTRSDPTLGSRMHSKCHNQNPCDEDNELFFGGELWRQKRCQHIRVSRIWICSIKILVARRSRLSPS